ncbi:MAG: cation-transporting P-type ATPase [bacterium]|nr:cation-transporting P-type ATPase [bacterium]
METLLGKHWHHLPTQEIIELLDTDPQKGLDLFEVKRRQEHFGPNQLTPRKGKSPILRFLAQFHNPLIYILLVASVITLVLKDVVDAVVIFAVVLVNAIVGFIQESKAEKAIEALAKVVATETTVIRARKQLRVNATELVPGDIVLVKSGDKVPADIRLIRSRDLQVAEATLTGESVPVMKEAEEILPKETILADRRNMIYASTLVTYGQGEGIVIATGDNTEVGRISQLLSEVKILETPLTRKIARFSEILLYVILSFSAITFIFGVYRGEPIVDMLMAAIALAVGAIPEGLPAAITITLAIGVARMAKRRAIIRKLPAVETIGSTTVICSDKTGTLTQNQMTVKAIVVGDQYYQVSGTGYKPTGEILAQEKRINLAETPALKECLLAGMLCNDSVLLEKAGVYDAQGDPTEVALLVSGLKAGLSSEKIAVEYSRLDSIPFESQHQYMATLHAVTETQKRIAYLKGAGEVIIEKCSTALDSFGNKIALDKPKIFQQINELAAQGLRVLAFARAELSDNINQLRPSDISTGLTFLGLQGMIDPPRPEAITAVKACQNAGICVKMITGDHALTAAAIAKQLGLQRNTESKSQLPPVLTGKEITEYADEQLITAVEQTSVFARVSPEQKLRLVEALQSRHHIVAMTGDGVNDAPALKKADIGIAMGISGTDVAKESADMVLTDDNFASIEAAVEEGRGIFDNIVKFITWTLPTNLGEALVIMAAIFSGTILPVLPIQLLWINMTTASVLGIMLAFELKEPDLMLRPPRNPQAPILTKTLVLRLLTVGFLILLGAFWLFRLELRNGASLAEARTVAVNTVVMVELFYLFNCRSLTRSMVSIGILSNRWLVVGVIAMIILQLLFTYIPIMNRLFGSAPINVISWLRILTVSSIVYIIIEIEKWLRMRSEQKGIRDSNLKTFCQGNG